MKDNEIIVQRTEEERIQKFESSIFISLGARFWVNVNEILSILLLYAINFRGMLLRFFWYL